MTTRKSWNRSHQLEFDDRFTALRADLGLPSINVLRDVESHLQFRLNVNVPDFVSKSYVAKERAWRSVLDERRQLRHVEELLDKVLEAQEVVRRQMDEEAAVKRMAEEEAAEVSQLVVKLELKTDVVEEEQ